MVVSEKVVLKRLMPPLVEALRCSEGLVTLALHTLEYWVDSLNPEFLEPAMLPVIGELMRALWTHLRPVQDSQFGAKVRPAALVTALLTSLVQAYCAKLSLAVLAAHVLGCLTVSACAPTSLLTGRLSCAGSEAAGQIWRAQQALPHGSSGAGPQVQP